ncbi:hypothetical protein GCM10009677_32860 [Sphaerisporangium rubeum]|uniref:Uncharacterized protein n=1 Tax=Sphaerisporangium rubeum TaxID=321317 RepID=A0A7X0M991_9ACTN|nr:hypothetical protein [Sphaerisporangium rubeum]MBB6474814.1 hypothetical protein [Sphaerisporangium rubeum]
MTGNNGGTPARKVSATELLDIRERAWAKRLRGCSLVAEVEVPDAYSEQVAGVLGPLYAKWVAGRRRPEDLFMRWPACFAVAMTGVAARSYQHGTFWPMLWTKVRHRALPEEQTIWGKGFAVAVDSLGMPTFPGMPTPYLGPILMHTGIPTFCLEDYFRLLLQRRTQDPGLDAEGFLAWATATGREHRIDVLDVPVRRFLQHGTEYAYDFVERTFDLLDRLDGTASDIDAVGLPERVLKKALDLSAEGKLDLTARAASRVPGQRRWEQPRIALDPYGRGVEVVLPAVGDTPDGLAVWHVTADGMTATVRSRAQWVGVAEAAPSTTYPLPKPVLSVAVSLAGWHHRVERSVVDPKSPMLVFSEDGRRLADNLPLPPDAVWVVHPEEHDLNAEGKLRVVVEGELPLGWNGWRLRQISLEGARSLGLDGVPGSQRPVRGYARPRIVTGDPVTGVATPYGSSVLSRPPDLWLPGQAGADTTWMVDVRRSATGGTVVSRTLTVQEPTTVTDLWSDAPRPLLGGFDIVVRGPLGRGTVRTVFLAEGLSVDYSPVHRLFTPTGLVTARAELKAGAGGQAHPARLSFASHELSQVVEFRADGESEPLVVTPPHVQVLRQRTTQSSAWLAGPLRMATESFADDPGTLLVRVPGAGSLPAVQVVVGGRVVQEVEPGGQARDGVARYELARMSGTIEEHKYADLSFGSGAMFTPLAFVRPRQLATGVTHDGDRLVLRDPADVEGLAAAVYALRAPWREPAEAPVHEGTVVLPPDLCDAGPLLVVLQIEDPWTFNEWPRWPDRFMVAGADGYVRADDPEETALSRFLADAGPFPERVTDLGRLWWIVELAGKLAVPSDVRRLVERCCRPLRERPAEALARLIDLGLPADRMTSLLVTSGLAATAVPGPEHAETALAAWPVMPAAALLLTGLDDPDCLESAERQCGDDLTAIWRDGADPHATVGRFGPEVKRMKLMTDEQLEGIWRAANVIPKALLDPDTRLVAARRLFDARVVAAAATVGRTSSQIVRTAHRLVAKHPRLAEQIRRRENPEGLGGWYALPAASIALACVARLAARGDAECRSAEQLLRTDWAWLAAAAPDLVAIDLVLAELLVAAHASEDK